MNALFAYPTPMAIFWAVLALLAATVVFWLATRGGERAPAPAWVAVAVLLSAATLPAIGYIRSLTPYHVQVTVPGVSSADRDKIKVWSSAEGGSTKTENGWRIDIPASQVPGNRTVMVWAAVNPGDLRHSKIVELRNDHWPAIVIPVRGGFSQVAGFVQDTDGKPVNGALVALAGRGETAIMTQFGGSFVIPVPVDSGDQVQLEISAFGRLSNVWANVGDNHLVIAVGKQSSPGLDKLESGPQH